MFVILEAVLTLLLMQLGPAKTHTASGAANSPYQSLWQLLTRFTHTHPQITLSTETSCSCPGTLSPQDSPSLSPPESLGGGKRGMKLPFPLALALQGSPRHSGGRFNDPLRPCSPRPGSSGRLSVTREGRGGE